MWLTCLHCGQTFYGNGKFCSSKCESNFLNPPVPKIVKKKNVCRFCGQKIDRGFYCSEKCKRENQDYTYKLVCVTCKKNFMGSHETKYCSPECRQTGFVKNLKKRSPDKCIQCGGPMPTDYIGTCSKECQIEFNEER